MSPQWASQDSNSHSWLAQQPRSSATRWELVQASGSVLGDSVGVVRQQAFRAGVGSGSSAGGVGWAIAFGTSLTTRGRVFGSFVALTRTDCGESLVTCELLVTTGGLSSEYLEADLFSDCAREDVNAAIHRLSETTFAQRRLHSISDFTEHAFRQCQLRLTAESRKRCLRRG